MWSTDEPANETSARPGGAEAAAASGETAAGPGRRSILDEQQRIEALMAAAAEGDQAAQRAVDDFFSDPGAAWQQLGSLADAVKRVLASKLAGGSPVHREALERRIQYQIGQLAGADASPLETLAAERVVLASQIVEAQELLAVSNGTLSTPAATKAFEAAERRIHSAVKTLQLTRAMRRREESGTRVAARQDPSEQQRF